MRGLIASAAACLLTLGPGAGAAQAACNQARVVEAGDTVFSLAQESYGDHEKWALIYCANQEALESAPSPVPCAIVWEDDWSKHLFPVLAEKQADMGFPWLKPDCAATPDNARCANFHFSDPLVEILIMLFVRADDGFRFKQDEDVLGKMLCRPEGYFTHDLDRAGREWLKQGLITLVQAESPQACFDLLTQGAVDAVTVNVFLGANTIGEMDLRGQVVPLERPLSSEGLHAIISKTHWRGTTFPYRLNAGLAALKASDRYNEIVSRHLAVFWDNMKRGSS